MKVLLIYPEVQSSVTNTATYSLPLGLGAIATYCHQIFGNEMEVKILDGSMMVHHEQEMVLKEYQPDIVGFSPTIASMGNAYSLAKQAKEAGALVVFGGVNATNLWHLMLANRPFIDAVILFEGEEAMVEILRRWRAGFNGEKIFSNIANVAYRTHEAIVGPSKIRVFANLDELPDIDYSLFDLPHYFEQTEARGFGRAMSYYAGKGCTKRSCCRVVNEYAAADYSQQVQAMKTCSFCGRNELGFRTLSADRETALLRRLHDEQGVHGFFNIQDTVNLNCEDPIGIEDSWFRVFIGAESITPPNIQRLKRRYGQHLIFQTGIESADPRIRRMMGKKEIDEADIFTKVELLARDNIQLHASFIFGGCGETITSMTTTSRMIRRLADYPNVTWILISPQIILPGSPDHYKLLEKEAMQDKWGNKDLIDITEINQDFLRFFAPELTRGKILETIGSIFADIRAKTPDRRLVLDIKGVVPEEEKTIAPRRYYCG
jgi:radical SAM superfamily enzyme YgiQ (UPF0313 family)